MKFKTYSATDFVSIVLKIENKKNNKLNDNISKKICTIWGSHPRKTEQNKELSIVRPTKTEIR